MKRRSFIKMTGMSVSGIFATGSIAGLFSACQKEHHLGLVTKPVMVVEGDFSNLLNYPLQTGANFTLTAQTTSTNLKGSSISVLGYQPNKILGPTIRINNGERANILLQNNLSEPTNVHFHGLKVPSNMDGHPDQIVNGGNSFQYQFIVNQRAGLSWYHPHPHGNTGKQVAQGLAGIFIINDAEETALNLPSGQFELPLIIQDKLIGSSGIKYNPSMEEIMAGYLGDSVFVNGNFAPFTEVSTRMYRLRILNASNARVYNLALSNNDDLIIIGNDGGLLKTPTIVKEILVAPGERLDVLVNFSNTSIGSEIYLMNKEFLNGGVAQGKQSFKIMKFKVSILSSSLYTIPTNLSIIPTISTAVKTRTFEISNEMEHHGVPVNNGMQMRHRINEKLYLSSRIDESVATNTNEIWVFDNSKGDEPHPMHLHGVFFQILERIGGRGNLIASESGWKDTVLVLPGEIVKIIIPFENNTGKFVFHCHNLEHEDDGMMLQYQLN